MAKPLSSDLTALLATRREGHGMPRAFYNTDALYAEEVARIWQGGWLFAGFTIEIPKPGDFITLTVDNTPVLVMRDDAGEVRAFHNVCRHRGAKVAQGCGKARLFSCPYHAWTYDLSGQLMGIPDERCFPDVRGERARSSNCRCVKSTAWSG